MKRSLPGIVLAAVMGCGSAEIPPIEIGGGGGARLMNGKGENIYEAYKIAYSNLTKQHYNVRRNMEARGRNRYGARIAMERITRYLQQMRLAVTPEFQEAMDPYIKRYKGWVESIRTGTWGGSFMSDFNRGEREIKSRFNPGKVAYATAAPAPSAETAPAAAVPAPPAAKPASSTVPSDRAEIPAVKAAPKPAPTAAPAQAPRSAPKPAISLPVAYRAWSGAHDALVKAYQAKKDCAGNYAEVVEALGLMKASAKAGRATKLQIYVEYYAQIHKKTGGFTTLPEKTTHQEIVEELDVAARVIRGDFNPDK